MKEFAERKDFVFEPIEKLKETSFQFDWGGHEPNQEVEKVAEKLLRAGIVYLREVIGKDYPFPPTYRITLGKRLANLGAQMWLDTIRLSGYETADQNIKDFEQSQVIHELVHNLRDEEDVPMLAELTYMSEHRHVWRFRRLQTLIQEGKLPTKHTDGLRVVAERLSVSFEDFLAGSVEGKTMRAALNVAGRELIDEYNKELKANESQNDQQTKLKWNIPNSPL